MPGHVAREMVEAGTIVMFKRNLDRHVDIQGMEGWRACAGRSVSLTWHHDHVLHSMYV